MAESRAERQKNAAGRRAARRAQLRARKTGRAPNVRLVEGVARPTGDIRNTGHGGGGSKRPVQGPGNAEGAAAFRRNTGRDSSAPIQGPGNAEGAATFRDQTARTNNNRSNNPTNPARAPSRPSNRLTFRQNAGRFGTALLAAAPIPFYEGDDRARESVLADLNARRGVAQTGFGSFLIGTADFLIPDTQSEAALNIAIEAAAGPALKGLGVLGRAGARALPRGASVGDDVGRLAARGIDDFGGAARPRTRPRAGGAPGGTGATTRGGRFKRPGSVRRPLTIAAAAATFSAVSYDGPIGSAFRPGTGGPWNPDGPNGPNDPGPGPAGGDQFNYYGGAGFGQDPGFAPGLKQASSAGEGANALQAAVLGVLGVAAFLAFGVGGES